MNYSDSLLRDPSAGTKAINDAGVSQINRNFDAEPDLISRSLAARGFGKSGALGDSLYQSGTARLGALSSFQAQMNKLILDRQQQGAAIGEDLLQANRGTTSTGTTTSSGTGVQTGPSNPAGNGLMTAGNGLSNLSTLLMLQKVLGGGGGGFGGGGGGGDYSAYSGDPGGG